MIKQTVLKLLCETPGALRYREVDGTGAFIHDDRDGSLVGDVYLRKMAMPKDSPEQIKVILEY